MRLTDQTRTDRFWLIGIPARRLAGPYFDTRVIAVDRAAVEAVAERARADALPAPVHTTRRGVPFVVLPGSWLRQVTTAEPDRWGLAVVSLGYLRDVVAGHDARQMAAPLDGDPPGIFNTPAATIPDDDGPNVVGEEYRRWEL